MTERWKIVVLIIVVILALIFAFFGGLAVGQRNAPSDNKTTKTDSNGSLERKAEESSSKNAEETALADGKASQKDNPQAKPQSEKNSEDKKSADSQGSAPKTDTPDTIEDTIKGNYAPNSIGHVLLSRKSRRKTVTLEADNEGGNSETATVTDTDSSLLRSTLPPKYTLSTTRPMRLKLAQLHINRLNALGHNAYLVNVRNNDDNRSMVFMRIGQYTTRMEAKKVAFSLLSLDNTRFEVFRIASSAKN